MSTENLNDFYNSNKFNQKLRSRIDNFEPELSDSLWDRIEHDLNGKEKRNRKVILLVYALVALLVVSGAGIFYLADQNKKLARNAEISQNVSLPAEPAAPVTQGNKITPDNGSGNTVQTPEKMSQSETSGLASYPDVPGKLAIPPTPVNRNQVQDKPAAIQETLTPTPAAITAEEPVSQQTVTEPVAVIEPEMSSLVPEPGTIEEEVPANGLQPTPAASPVVNNVNVSNNNKILFYAGVFAGSGKVNNKAYGPNAGKFFFESPVQKMNTGIFAGIMLPCRVTFQAGLNYYETGEAAAYSLKPRPSSSVNPSIVVAPYNGDIISHGNNLKHTNTQTWLEIPVQAGYVYNVGSRWKVQGSAGVSYSMIQSFEGYQPNPGFTNFDVLGKNNPNPYKNHFNMTTTAGIGYSIFKNLTLSANVNYRKALNNISNEVDINFPERRPSFIGGSFGLTYLLNNK